MMGTESSQPLPTLHFSPSEIAALKQEHERHKIKGLAGNNRERLREAMQRRAALTTAGEMQTDEYAECLYELGLIYDAIDLVQDPIKKAYWSVRRDTIERDGPCSCPSEVKSKDGKVTMPTKHEICKYPSYKREGKLVPIVICLSCGAEGVEG